MGHPRYTAEQITSQGRQIYEERLRALLEPEHLGRYLVVDIETGEFLVGDNHGALSRELQARRPGSPLYAARVGSRALGRIGGRMRSVSR